MVRDWIRRDGRHGMAALAGLALALSFPGTSWAGLAWVGPALLMEAGRGATPGQRWCLGYLAGWIHHGVALRWLWEIPVPGYPILGWIALVSYLALYPAVWLWWGGSWLNRAGSWAGRQLAALMAAAVWVALEMMQARWLGGFPWNLLGASQFEMIPLVQLASVTGVYGLSFVVVWVSLGLYNAARAIAERPTQRYGWMRELGLPGGALLVLFGWGWQGVRAYEDGTRYVRVAVIQPSIPQSVIWDAGAADERRETVWALTREALQEPVDVLVWPEGGVPGFLRYDPDLYRAVTGLAREHGLWMVVGGDDAEPRAGLPEGEEADYFNAAFLVSPEGRVAGVYRKMQLVMFGEFIPWSDRLPFLRWFTPITGQYTPGSEAVVFELRGSPDRPDTEASPWLRMAPLICYEDVFPHLARRFLKRAPDVWVNLTNDGWFGESAAQWQHAANAVLRAVETGRPLIRCTNNGLTCWIDPLGRVRAVLRDEQGSVYGRGWAVWRVAVPDRDTVERGTFYSRNGDWWGWGCVSLAVTGTVWTWVRRWRMGSARDAESPA